MTVAEFTKQFVRISTAAERLHTDAATVYRRAQRGEIVSVTIDGSKFIEVQSLEKAIRDRELVATAGCAA